MSEPFDPATVVREHAGFVQRVLRHLGVMEQQLDDASQEVFLVVCRRLDAFEGRSSVRTWIYSICRNVAHAAQRKRTTREVLSSEPPEPHVQAQQDAELWVKEAHAQLLAALAALDEDQRMAFVLYELEELTMEEIASAVGAPLTTCYSRLKLARTKVQAAVRRSMKFRAVKPVAVLS